MWTDDHSREINDKVFEQFKAGLCYEALIIIKLIQKENGSSRELLFVLSYRQFMKSSQKTHYSRRPVKIQS